MYVHVHTHRSACARLREVQGAADPLECDAQPIALVELDLHEEGEQLARAAFDAARVAGVAHRVRLQCRHEVVLAEGGRGAVGGAG